MEEGNSDWVGGEMKNIWLGREKLVSYGRCECPFRSGTLPCSVLSFRESKIRGKVEFCELIFSILSNELFFDKVWRSYWTIKTCSCNEIYECLNGSFAPRIEMTRKTEASQDFRSSLMYFEFIVQVQRNISIFFRIIIEYCPKPRNLCYPTIMLH